MTFCACWYLNRFNPVAIPSIVAACPFFSIDFSSDRVMFACERTVIAKLFWPLMGPSSYTVLFLYILKGDGGRVCFCY